MTPSTSARFFDPSVAALGPTLTDELVRAAETQLGIRLPSAYVALLRTQNGGRPLRRCLRTSVATSWSPDHIEVTTLMGLGYDDGIDGEFGSAYLVTGWGYPSGGVVVFDTPSAGHDAVLLDYRACGPHGEPRVIYADDGGAVVHLADDFFCFVDSLVDCSYFDHR